MNTNTQNAEIEAISETTLVLGIDVGSETHYARAFDFRGIEYSKKPFKFSNTEAGFMTFKAWILDIKEKHGKDKVVPGMEPTGHYWFNLGNFLQDNEMKPVLVNPHHVKKSKELDDNNPTKNDRKDPKVIAGLYPVSEAFLQAVQENTRRYYWTGRITTTKGVSYEFGADDIVKGSGYISSQCCGSS